MSVTLIDWVYLYSVLVKELIIIIIFIFIYSLSIIPLQNEKQHDEQILGLAFNNTNKHEQILGLVFNKCFQ